MYNTIVEEVTVWREGDGGDDDDEISFSTA